MNSCRQVEYILEGIKKVRKLCLHRFVFFQDGELELFLLDYQGFQISSPLMDLMYFLVLSSDKEFRSKHYHQLLDLYYSELSSNLKRLHVDPETVYTKDDFQHDVKFVRFFFNNIHWR